MQGARAPGVDGRAEQRHVEHSDLGGRCALAVCGVLGAGRRVQRRERGGGGEADHADLVGDGAEGDGPEAAGEGVGGERAQDGRHRGRAAEVGQRVGRLHQRQVQLLRQVRDQVGVEAGHGEPVADLARCNGQAMNNETIRKKNHQAKNYNYSVTTSILIGSQTHLSSNLPSFSQCLRCENRIQ